jgi:hypothetical protein
MTRAATEAIEAISPAIESASMADRYVLPIRIGDHQPIAAAAISRTGDAYGIRDKGTNWSPASQETRYQYARIDKNILFSS